MRIFDTIGNGWVIKIFFSRIPRDRTNERFFREKGVEIRCLMRWNEYAFRSRDLSQNTRVRCFLLSEKMPWQYHLFQMLLLAVYYHDETTRHVSVCNLFYKPSLNGRLIVFYISEYFSMKRSISFPIDRQLLSKITNIYLASLSIDLLFIVCSKEIRREIFRMVTRVRFHCRAKRIRAIFISRCLRRDTYEEKWNRMVTGKVRHRWTNGQ